MPDEQLKAKVFISCGQQRDTDELQIAHRIGEDIEKLGYVPYIATEQQNIRGVRQNIFDELESSEYFVFIDFKREALLAHGTTFWKRIFQAPKGFPRRGSLFSHQELALASYLDMPIIAFQEKGVKRLDGLMQFLQVNAEVFSDRHLLPAVIAHRARERWNPHWKNQLRLETIERSFAGGPDRMVATHFHIDVKNLHYRKSAINCQVYLERAHRIDTKQNLELKTIELKWAGHELPGALIFPGGQYQRSFDAFCMSQAEPNWCEASSFADIGDYRWKIEGPGEFELTYVVYSYNFPPARITCQLILADNWDEMSFKPISETCPKGEAH